MKNSFLQYSWGWGCREVQCPAEKGGTGGGGACSTGEGVTGGVIKCRRAHVVQGGTCHQFPPDLYQHRASRDKGWGQVCN